MEERRETCVFGEAVTHLCPTIALEDKNYIIIFPIFKKIPLISKLYAYFSLFKYYVIMMIEKC